MIAPFRCLKPALVMSTACLAGTSAFAAAPDSISSLRIEVISSRPGLVTGDSALVRIDHPPNDVSAIRVTLNGKDVTPAFATDGDGPAMVGLVRGLRPGENLLRAAKPGTPEAKATLVVYPVSGPVISGAHEQPFICDTERFKLIGGSTLGKPLDADCSIATRVDYAYRSSNGGSLKPLPDPKVRPPDVASTTTNAGVSVPYIVRVESGTINRAIYQISMLHNPATEAEPDFRRRPAGWNGRLIYTFGGGCAGGWYHQGASTGGVDDDAMLREGYAVASASLNVFGHNCNDLLAAETMMMVKERFIEAYGPPNFTIGFGCSGGSYQGHQIADNYPGLLDGIVVGCSFPDVGYTSMSVHSFGARLMFHYFQTTSEPWTKDQAVAASGLPDYDSLSVQGTRPDRIRPRDVCDPVIPPDLLYDPAKRPRGARCTVYDHTINVYGKDPATGFARRFLDNVGVQYGLLALEAGQIGRSQFLDLNEKIGGVDIDANFVPARTVGDVHALRVAYESGRILNGGGGLAATPIIDYRGYADFAKGDPHMRFYSFSTRERLIRANGHADNQVMLLEDGETYGLFSTKSPVVREAIRQMDRWLAAIESDRSSSPRAEKVVRARPVDLVDACYGPGGKKIAEKLTYKSGECDKLFPSHGSPYLTAGMPITSDVVKCQLKPIAPTDYKISFSAGELARLRHIFPDGVCDYSRPGIEQVGLKNTWLSFGPSPANRIALP